MSKINFTLNTILILIITATVSYSYIFSDKILKNLRHLNIQSKKYLGYSVPYLENEKKNKKTKSEVLKNFSSKKTFSKDSTDTKKKNYKKKSYSKDKKKRKKSTKRKLSLEKRIKILENEIKKLKREKR